MLSRKSKKPPKWLSEYHPGDRFSLRKFMQSRVVFYPGAGSDFHPIKLFGSSGASHGPTYPVTQVNWYDAVNWCNAKSDMKGLDAVYHFNEEIFKKGEFGEEGSEFVIEKGEARGYRLPTSIEWEWAARGGEHSQGFKFAGSDDKFIVGCHLDRARNVRAFMKGEAYPVGEKRPNELGIHDMSGYVLEWCSDLDGDFRWYRDGSCGLNVCDYHIMEEHYQTDARSDEMGFRLARTSETKFKGLDLKLKE